MIVYTNYNWCPWYSHRRIIKGTGGLGNNRTRGGHRNYYIIEIGQNTKSPRGLRRLAVSQNSVNDHQHTLAWKTRRRRRRRRRIRRRRGRRRRTNYIKVKTDMNQKKNNWMLCKEIEIINYIINKCSKLTQKALTIRRYWEGKVITGNSARDKNFTILPNGTSIKPESIP